MLLQPGKPFLAERCKARTQTIVLAESATSFSAKRSHEVFPKKGKGTSYTWAFSTSGQRQLSSASTHLWPLQIDIPKAQTVFNSILTLTEDRKNNS